jgi:DNA-binding PadR family transcriptional regulator
MSYDIFLDMFYDDSNSHTESRRERHRSRRHGRNGILGSRDQFTSGRKFEAVDLQLVILALLAERPAHGYELIKTIEERSGGFYTPSPGVIYPALTYLSEIGHASVEQAGTRKLYSVTAEGKSHLASNRASADAILDSLSRIGSRMDDVREAFAGVGDPDSGPSGEIHRARLALRDAIRRKRGCEPNEARRIVRILDRATADILSKQP